MNDLKFAFRQLLKNPGFTAVAVLTLALGIGANTSMFSLVDALLLRTLPVKEPKQLVILKRVEAGNRTVYDLPYPMFERLREQAQVFSDVAATWLIERVEAADHPGADPGQVRVGMASGNYFSMLGVQTAIGRTFTSEENLMPGGHPLAVISYAYWERRFARASDIVGRALVLGGTKYAIVGVTPKGFTGEWASRPADLWVPFMMASQVMPEVPGGPARFPALVTARLKPGVTTAQAQAASQMLYQQVLMSEAGSNPTPQQRQFIAQRQIGVESGARGYSAQRQTLTRPLAVLAGMVGLVMLAVCANVANLLLARAAGREREMAVRRALGAAQWRIVRQLLTENLLLTALSGALGFFFATWGTKALTAMLTAGPLSVGIEDNSITLDLRSDWRAILCTGLLSLVASFLVSLAPARNGSKAALMTALKERHTSGRGGQAAFGKSLVIAQVALSFVLLVATGLLVRTQRNLQAQDVGFDRNNLLLVWTAPVRTGRTVPALADLAGLVQAKLASLPGVRSASVSSGGVLDGNERGAPSETLQFQGQSRKPGLVTSAVAVSPGFFETVGMPLVAGRDFNERDAETAPQVAIVSETMGRFFFGNENPIGKRFNALGGEGFPIEIVGVAKDAKLGTPRDRRGAWFFPYRQNARFLRVNWCVAVRSTVNASSLAVSVRQALRELDATFPVLKVTTLEGQLDRVLAQERMLATLSTLFGVLALLLSSMGLYGVIAYSVTQRAREIGIRMALGGQRRDVQGLVLRQGLKLAGLGIGIGLIGALATTKLLRNLLFGITPTDPITFVVIALLLVAIAGLACWLPARRAARVDPMVALRAD